MPWAPLVPWQPPHHPAIGIVAPAQAELFGFAAKLDGGADLIDLLPGNAQGVGAPALGSGQTTRERAQSLRQSARIERLADQERRDPRRISAQLDVVDPPAASPFGVEDLLVEQAVGN